MGCSNSTKRQDEEAVRINTGANKQQNLYHTTTEFDISSDSEDEHAIFSIKGRHSTNRNNLARKVDKLTSGLTTAYNSSSTARDAQEGGQLQQTAV